MNNVFHQGQHLWLQKQIPDKQLAGTFTTTRLVNMDQIILPEFHRSQKIDFHECRIFKTECPYNIIVGQDFPQMICMGFDFEAVTFSAIGNTIAMKHKNFYDNPFASLIEIVQNYYNFDDDKEIFASFHTATKTIKESTYTKAAVELVAKQQKHLSSDQQEDRLLSVLRKRSKLFSGKLGHYTGKKMYLELIPGAVLVHQKNYMTMEKELLSIYKTSNEFRSMLLGAQIDIFTDHKNLTYSFSVNQQIIRQLNYIDEFAPKYNHIPGDNNFLGASLSPLPIRDDLDYPSEEE
jgi:hypothetical protein